MRLREGALPQEQMRQERGLRGRLPEETALACDREMAQGTEAGMG